MKNIIKILKFLATCTLFGSSVFAGFGERKAAIFSAFAACDQDAFQAAMTLAAADPTFSSAEVARWAEKALAKKGLRYTPGGNVDEAARESKRHQEALAEKKLEEERRRKEEAARLEAEKKLEEERRRKEEAARLEAEKKAKQQENAARKLKQQQEEEERRRKEEEAKAAAAKKKAQEEKGKSKTDGDGDGYAGGSQKYKIVGIQGACQKDGNCGYNALYYALCLAGDSAEHGIADLTNVGKLDALVTPQEALIGQQRAFQRAAKVKGVHPGTNWLNGGEIELLKWEAAQSGLITREAAQRIFIIDDRIRARASFFRGQDYVKMMRHLKEPANSCAFVVNEGGHYIAVGLSREVSGGLCVRVVNSRAVGAPRERRALDDYALLFLDGERAQHVRAALESAVFLVNVRDAIRAENFLLAEELLGVFQRTHEGFCMAHGVKLVLPIYAAIERLKKLESEGSSLKAGLEAIVVGLKRFASKPEAKARLDSLNGPEEIAYALGRLEAGLGRRGGDDKGGEIYFEDDAGKAQDPIQEEGVPPYVGIVLQIDGMLSELTRAVQEAAATI